MVSLPYFEDFEHCNAPALTQTYMLPNCWEYVMTGTSASYTTGSYVPMLYSSTSYASSGNYSLRLYGRTVVALPEMPTNVNQLHEPRARVTLTIMTILRANADGLTDQIHHVGITREVEEVHMNRLLLTHTSVTTCGLEGERLQLTRLGSQSKTNVHLRVAIRPELRLTWLAIHGEATLLHLLDGEHSTNKLSAVTFLPRVGIVPTIICTAWIN
jgi:hypothetical protein